MTSRAPIVPLAPDPRAQRLFLYLAVTLYSFGSGLVTPLVAVLLTDAGRSSGLVGGCHAAGYLGVGVAVLAGPWLVARLGSRRTILAGLWAGGASIALLGLPLGIPALFLLRFATGAAGALVFIGAECRIVQESPPGQRGGDLGIYALLYGTAYSAGPLAGLGLLAWGGGRLLPFAVAGCLMLGGALFLARTLSNGPLPGPAPEAPAAGDADRAPAGSQPLACLCSFGSGFLDVAFLGLVPVVLRGSGMTPAGIGLEMTALVFLAGLAPLPAGWLCDRFSPRAALTGSCALTLGTGLALAATSGAAPAAWLLALYAFSFSAWYVLAVAEAARAVEPSAFPRVDARLLLAFSVGSLVGPALAGGLMDRWGPGALFLVGAAWAALQGTVLLAAPEPSARALEPEPEEDEVGIPA